MAIHEPNSELNRNFNGNYTQESDKTIENYHLSILENHALNVIYKELNARDTENLNKNKKLQTDEMFDDLKGHIIRRAMLASIGNRM